MGFSIKKRVPLIYIATVIDKWETFAPNGKIELSIMFHFDSTVHSERIEAVYSESVIKFVVGERTYTDIEEFCTVIESTVKNSLRLKG